MREDYRKELSVLAYPLSILFSKWLRNLSLAIKPAYRAHIKISSSTSVSVSGTMVVAWIKTERSRRQKKRTEKKNRERETGKQKENAENFHCLATAGPYGASERREWKRMNKAWNKLRYLFVPRVRLPSPYPAQRAAAVTTTTIAHRRPPNTFPARAGREAVIFRGLFRAFLWCVLDGTWTRMVYERIRSRDYLLSTFLLFSVYLTAPRGRSPFLLILARSSPANPWFIRFRDFPPSRWSRARRVSKSFIVAAKAPNERSDRGTYARRTNVDT